MTTTALVLVPEAALARLASGTDRVDAKETRAMIRSNPAGALAVLGNKNMSLWQSANLLDEIVGEVPNPAVAQQLIADHLSDGYTEELLAIRGDLPSSAAEVVEADRLIGAMLRDIGVGELDIPARALVFMTWSLKAKDRPDWGEILEMEIGVYTVMDLILLAIRSEFSELTADVFETHGIDCNDGRERLRELLEKRAGLYELDVEHARKALGNLRKVASASTGGDLNTLAAAAAAAVAAATEEDE